MASGLIWGNQRSWESVTRATEAVANCAKLGERDKAIISGGSKEARPEAQGRYAVAVISNLSAGSSFSTRPSRTKMQQYIPTAVRSVRGARIDLRARPKRTDSVGLTVSPLIR